MIGGNIMDEHRQTRYSRQVLFKPIGSSGQEKLSLSKILIVGMGALGTVIANHMARAGVGHIKFIDRDFVEHSNLQRQTLFVESDAGEALPKAVAAERRLKAINSDIVIEGIIGDLTPQNIDEYARDADLILDGTDNFQTRFVINDYAFKVGIPYIYGGAVSSRGMQAAFVPGETPCLRCFIDDNGGAGETCDTSGVIAPIIDIVASYQVTEALKLLTGNRDAVRNSLLTLDIWSGTQQAIRWTKPKQNCPTCQLKKYPALQQTEEEQITSLCGRETIQITARTKQKWDLKKWQNKLGKVGHTELTPFLLRCKVDDLQLVLFPDGRVLVQGTEDVTQAKNVYAKYIGM